MLLKEVNDTRRLQLNSTERVENGGRERWRAGNWYRVAILITAVIQSTVAAITYPTTSEISSKFVDCFFVVVILLTNTQTPKHNFLGGDSNVLLLIFHVIGLLVRIRICTRLCWKIKLGLYALWAKTIGGGAGGRGGIPPPPHLQTGGGGANGIKSPHFGDLVEWCLQAWKKHRHM